MSIARTGDGAGPLFRCIERQCEDQVSESTVRDYLASLSDGGGLEGFLESDSVDARIERGLEAAGGGDHPLLDASRRGLSKLETGEPLTDIELEGLEAIILPAERPVFSILNNAYKETGKRGQVWRLDDTDVRARLNAAIPSVGRVEIPGHRTIDYVGTCFLVGPQLLMTNRHVATYFVDGRGLEPRLRLDDAMQPRVNFLAEAGGGDEAYRLDVEKVLLVHPYWDVALFKVSGDLGGRSPLTLQMTHPGELDGRPVSIVGYPAQPGFVQPSQAEVLGQVFMAVFDVKRLQPGKARDTYAKHHEGHDWEVETTTHDASTLAGNSGSAVIDLATGHVVALHFGGSYMKRNYAVAAYDLGQDPHLRRLGVTFNQDPETQVPRWVDHWRNYESAQVAVRSEQEATGGAPAPRSVPARPVDAAQWYEEQTDLALVRALRERPDETKALLKQALGSEEAIEAIRDLPTLEDACELEGWFDRTPDPDLPEIVYLHGIMGGHLRMSLGHGRAWASGWSLVHGGLSNQLALSEDGTRDAKPGLGLVPDGHLRLFYAKAERRWRKDRFVVHTFSYDWRKPIDVAADALHYHLERLALERPHARFALVAHSMGGLVAARYATRHRSWQDRVEQAVFVGSPMGGSFEPVAAMMGPYAFFSNVGMISLQDSAESLHKIARGFPGLIDMLPAPSQFPEASGASAVYQRHLWPSGRAPAQRWLTRSRALKERLLESPLLPMTTAIVSDHRKTFDRLEGNGRVGLGTPSGAGDGTVPILSSAAPRFATHLVYRGDRGHSDMMKANDIIAAAADLLRNGQTARLPRLGEAPPLHSSELESVPVPVDSGLEVLVRAPAPREAAFKGGTWSADDLAWLLGSPGAKA